ncbi:hypothetical protein Fcan01_26522 [Folsomia candida]|uniref:Uncharacterized protein n=1 Tax=Folsomia candida TaxID=158441 RepID=A0A226D096_FOLCA|nr:hypothetical protein Fcan01_26522 [Folsomia candida]
MLFQCVIPLLQMQLRCLSNLGVQLILWNAKRRQFYPNVSNPSRIRLALGTLLTLVLNGCYTIFLRTDHVPQTKPLKSLGWNSCAKISKIGIQYYKQVEILISHLNYCFQPVVLPAILLYAVSVNIFCTFLTVSTKFRLLEHIGNATFPLMAVVTRLVLLALGLIAGLANKRSITCVVQMRKSFLSKTALENIVLKKMTRALAPMKIRFGNNFITVSTLLVMTAFCARSTVRLLLMDSV